MRDEAGQTRCIECGGGVASLNEDEEGVPCPVCAQRLLETLPGIFHAPWGPRGEFVDVDEDVFESTGDTDPVQDVGPEGPHSA